MKKIAPFLLLFLFAALPLFASNGDAFRKAALKEARIIGGGGDVMVKSFSSDGGYDRCKYVFMGREYDSIFPSTSGEKGMRNAFREAVSYNLGSGGERLDYVFLKSYSSVSAQNAHMGDIYKLKNLDGKTIASLRVNRVKDGVATFFPYHSKAIYPSLELKKGCDLFIRLTASSALKLNPFKPEFHAEMKKTSWLYPFNPAIEASYHSSGDFSFGLGVWYTLPLSSMNPTSISIVRNGEAFASAYVTALFSSGEASLGGRWSLGYLYHMGTHLSIGFEVGYDQSLSTSLGISLGVNL